MSQKNKPLVSVIIATKNEEKNIEECLRSIKRQTYSNIEIVVVDYSSTDRTGSIAQKYTKKIFQLSKEKKLSHIKNFRGAQVNFGVTKSKGSIIFFPDADMTLDRNLIRESVELIEKYRYNALHIPEIIVGRGILGQIRNFERGFYNMTCIDCVRIMKKDIFVRIGGFDETNIEFGPDDWDLMKSLKKKKPKMTITKHTIYHHEETLSLTRYIAKKIKYSSTFDSYIDKWGKDDEDIKKQFGFQYRFFGVFTEHGKWKKLIRYPHLAVGMFVLRGLIGLAYLVSSMLK